MLMNDTQLYAMFIGEVHNQSFPMFASELALAMQNCECSHGIIATTVQYQW